MEAGPVAAARGRRRNQLTSGTGHRLDRTDTDTPSSHATRQRSFSFFSPEKKT
jgi:hypothetical protein